MYRLATTSQTDRQTDRRQYHANSPSYCVAVGSAKTAVSRCQSFASVIIINENNTRILLLNTFHVLLYSTGLKWYWDWERAM